MRVSRSWRILFCFKDADVWDVGFVKYHWIMKDSMDTMHDPPHPGEVILELCLDGMNEGVAAKRLGVSRPVLKRLLDGQIGISRTMALSLEAAGWSNADFWLSLQAAYDLDREWLRRAEVD